ncbi:MAG: hypothetical protein GVY19_13705 [Bacteroidetes bacterium]|jgi:hypothetical protein|nr:hypothetical protein [Bacteroidota bacterium]
MQRLFLFFLLSIGALTASIHAQVYSVNHDNFLVVDYFSNLPIDDTAYIYQNGPAVLKAMSPDSTQGWEMRWQFLDTANQVFVDQMTVTDSVSYDTITNNGCYQVRMSKDTLVYNYRAWVLIIDTLDIVNPDKDEFDTLTPGASTCSQVLIKLQTNLDDWMYTQLHREGDSIYQTNNKFPFNLADRITVDWSIEPSKYDIPQTNGLILNDNSPPPVNSTYTAEARFLGFTDTDIAHLDAIATEAVLTAEAVNYEHAFYIDSLGTSRQLLENYRYNYDELFTPSSGPAPLWVSFTFDESENVEELHINFDDTLGMDDSTFTDVDQLIYRKYNVPGTYDIVLRATSSEGCEDESAPQSITVDEPDYFELPNVFIAGREDNYDFIGNLQDVFRMEDVSYQYIEISIYNRWGRRVHEYKGEIKEWTGWDGKIGNSNNFANPGVYYYVIRATNWHPPDDPTATRKIEEQGFFHLYHTREQ